MKKIISIALLYFAVVLPSLAINFPPTNPYNPFRVQGAFRIEIFKIVDGNATSVYKWSFRSSSQDATATLNLDRHSAYYVRLMGNQSRGTKSYFVQEEFSRFTGTGFTGIITRTFLNGTYTSSNNIGFFTRRVFFPDGGRNHFRLKGTYAGRSFSFGIPYRFIN